MFITSVIPTCALLCPWQYIGIRMWGCANFLMASMCVRSPAGGEASGPGQTGVTQHSQEADRLPAGSAGRRRGEEICQVTVCECSHPSPPLTSTCCSVRWCTETLLKLCDVAPLCFQKKLPLTILAQCLVEGAAVLGDDSLLGWGTSPKHTPSTHTNTDRGIFNYWFGYWIPLCPGLLLSAFQRLWIACGFGPTGRCWSCVGRRRRSWPRSSSSLRTR